MDDLFERDESWGVGSTDTGATVLDWLVGDTELAQVVADHVGLWEGEKKNLRN